MPALDGTLLSEDVAAFMQGRLDGFDPGLVEFLLTAAVDDARRVCGWHVTPQQEDVVTLDGPGGALLVLPTLRLASVTEVVEDGVVLDLDNVALGHSRSGYPDGRLYKKDGTCWALGHGNITVTYTHGYADAPGWWAAVLSAVNRTAKLSSDAPTAVGPFRWETDGTTLEQSMLGLYRLERPA